MLIYTYTRKVPSIRTGSPLIFFMPMCLWLPFGSSLLWTCALGSTFRPANFRRGQSFALVFRSPDRREQLFNQLMFIRTQNMHMLILTFALLGSVSASEASTLPFPTSDLDQGAQDHRTSYGLMNHSYSYGLMTHGNATGSLPVDTLTNTTAHRLQEIGYPPVFRLGSGAVTPQSPLTTHEVSKSQSADRYNIYKEPKGFLLPRREPGANRSNMFPVVHPNPNTFRTTTSTVLSHGFAETTTHPHDMFEEYESFTMDEHAINNVPNISEQFTLASTQTSA